MAMMIMTAEGTKNTCVKWHVTHKPRADISHRRQQSLAAQRGGEKWGWGVEVDCLHCLMRLMPSVSRFSHSNVQEATGVSEDDPRMGIPSSPPPSPRAKVCSLIYIRCKDREMGCPDSRCLHNPLNEHDIWLIFICHTQC